MRSILFLCFSLLAIAKAGEIIEEEGVLVLTKDNFQQAITDNTFILVEFYAPWCGHCKALAPEYAQAAQKLAEEGSEIKLAKVDATVENDLAEQYEVRGYPTIKFFKEGVPKDYAGGRTANDIVNWVKRNSGPAVAVMNSVDEIKAFIEKYDVAVVGYFTANTTEEAVAYMAAASGSSEHVQFAMCTCSDTTKGMETKENTVILYKKFDEGKAVFPGNNWTAESLLEFVQAEEMPLVTKFTDENAPRIFGGSIRVHLLGFFSSDDEKYQSYMDALTPVARSFKGKILVVHIDSKEEETGRVMEFFDIGEADLPQIRLITLDQDMKRFLPPTNEFDVEKLTTFVQKYFDGELTPHRMTEEIPDDWDTKPVKVLVGKNFKDVALDPSKHVFVEFYAPWCGHCKQLAPTWEKLADHFKDDSDVIIAKMDSTKNEVDEVQIQGFPTLVFFPKGSDEKLDYDGGRTLEELIQYVEKRVAGEPIEEPSNEPLDGKGGEDEPEPEGDDVPKDEL